MRVPAVGAAAAHLPWLAPRAASLVALARRSAVSAWDELHVDPGFLLLALRQPALREDASPAGFIARCSDAELLEMARSLLDAGAGYCDWSDARLTAIYATAQAMAGVARQLAGNIGAVEPECAAAASFLAPLGWFAVAAVDPLAAAECLLNGTPECEDVQRGLWGLDAGAIARRLCRRWRLPAWLSTILGALDLTAAAATALGANGRLFRIVQLSARIVQQAGAALQLRIGVDLPTLLAELNLDAAAAGELELLAKSLLTAAVPSGSWDAPGAQPLLGELLDLAIQNRRLSESPAFTGVDDDADRLHAALREQHATETERLRGLKVRALAEFAAGAGHEINNPLAVISGQAQYLLAQEPDPARQRSLQKIVGQAQRVHHILTDLMQFARPPQPRPQVVNVSALIGEAAARVQDLAVTRGVRLECKPVDPPVHVWADAKQAQSALTALLRNAVEAAPADGWAGIRVLERADDSIELHVEDNGGGPTAVQAEHLFDPFYSGRPAGRGRGLGLPTAWQLARVNGGAVIYAGVLNGVTRFSLSLPRATDPSQVAPEVGVGELAPTLALPALPGMPATNGHAPSVGSEAS